MSSLELEKETKMEDETTETPPSNEFGSNVQISGHPILAHKLAILRSSNTCSVIFRAVLREITFILGYEATDALNTKPVELTVPVGQDHIPCTGRTIKDKIALIPIMRSGLGMVDSMLELYPNSMVHHIGMYNRNNMPVQYYNRLPKKCAVDVAFVLDPVIGSARTMKSVLGQLKKWGVPKIHIVSVVATEKGIISITTDHPDVKISVGEVDGTLSDAGKCIPGLGDAGDRLYGTPLADDEEELVHKSKRKRDRSTSDPLL
mmetsp:Transcript_36533/g.53599  ORF Transcript_36533/g.53599 Transcript_36533/m.53599 type:complete len:261 (-) Transcript_36533:285-1067(-)|eukprot:CAMPEP_0195518374 /NCGR_PEP_ID=MMETSP0794_2-20130614/12752_1 /TAXON_ID=515487 /ORGANISM="Stephanopyxis turris, Strain CCMP 815" /LENGTH=260 /DNA_ID=CAMNT_0040647323 /DNA_START=166 /DNA_END=951 /DNA_ORIENTATION=-